MNTGHLIKQPMYKSQDQSKYVHQVPVNGPKVPLNGPNA